MTQQARSRKLARRPARSRGAPTTAPYAADLARLAALQFESEGGERSARARTIGWLGAVAFSLAVWAGVFLVILR